MVLSKKKKGLLFFLCVFVIPISALFYIEEKTNYFSDFVFEQKKTVGDIRAVKCSVQTNLNNQTFVLLDFLIPYTNEADQLTIERAIPQIRNRVIQELSSEMAVDIEEKKFKRIKKQLIEIINDTVDANVSEVYIDNFNLRDQAGRSF